MDMFYNLGSSLRCAISYVVRDTSVLRMRRWHDTVTIQTDNYEVDPTVDTGSPGVRSREKAFPRGLRSQHDHSGFSTISRRFSVFLYHGVDC
jgi:hypothetical protein